jgi:transposase
MQTLELAGYCTLGAGPMRGGSFSRPRNLIPRMRGALAWRGPSGRFTRWKRRAREGNLPAPEREALRAAECPALLKKVKELISKTASEVLPQSALGKACTYALKQWDRLERYAEPRHGMVEIDNNWAENAMRGVSLGRKNWLQIGSERAGPKVAALLSVLESCKPPRVNVGEYLLGD